MAIGGLVGSAVVEAPLAVSVGHVVARSRNKKGMTAMAGEKDAVIELEDDGVVTVDIGGDTELAAAADQLAVGAVVTTKEKPGAVTVQRKPSAADEAAAVLTQSLRTAEEGRRAAEATALAERNARAATERTLAQRDQEAAALRETAASAELQTVTTGIENATRSVEALTGEIERAAEAGDFKAQAVAQAKLASAAAKLDRLEADKASFESGTRKAPTTEGRVVEAGTPFERYVSRFSPKAQTWLRSHPECAPSEVGGSSTKNDLMMAGHHEAKAKGFAEDSDEYYRVIEERAGYREPVSAAAEVTVAGERQQPKPQLQRRPTPSAPPSRDSEATGAQSKSVRLTAQQQEVALLSYRPARPGEDEAAWKAQAFGSYARELVKAQAEGKIGRMSH